MNEEIKRHEPWTGNNIENKNMLDKFIQGGNYIYTDSKGTHRIQFGQGFLNKYKNRKFVENLGEYEYNANNSEIVDEDYNSTLVNNKKKRVIIYTLQN